MANERNPAEENEGPQMTKPIVYLPTVEAYDRWAEVYDTDNNVLQGVDDLELRALLPQFLDLLPPSPKIVDVGCGTGRNTRKLLGQGQDRTIVGLDASPKMLEVASSRCNNDHHHPHQTGESEATTTASRVDFEVYDAITSEKPPSNALSADGVICTLVVEHVPITTLFEVLSTILKPDGVLLLTNMHPHMGAESQAGFTDPVSGEKIRPKSYVHSIPEVLEGAFAFGFDAVGEVSERAVWNEDVETLGPRARKWIGTQVWFGVIFRKRRSS
ncbi:MAG: hypothetical protein M1837_005424 [Sclerophora amabilis]|nr:MAG: hypothetical protein M1837_005424 [Sclerophora amabilis]